MVDEVARERAGTGSTPQVRTLLLTDLCDSTMLVEKLGDAAAAELFREHDRLVLGLQQQWRGRLIDRSDGLLLLFERAIDGLGFALDYARGLRDIGERRKLSRYGVVLQARAGLHVGEVLTWRNSDAAVTFGAKPLEVEGLAKPMAGRLMTMARPGQILLSATAEPLAHRAARELGERGGQLVWKSWGRWRLKGVPQAQEVHEVGEPDIAPLRPPRQDRGKAWRDIPLWRRPGALAAELLLVAGLATGAWFLARPQPAIAFAERDWVVVADLRNLTGDTLLDASLEQAFRISLEQSRYVNVLSDLKARETLAQMRREPDTALDRTLASEVALRDGARAVILPTVAEVGGRVRVSAEVIDPYTQATVYAESADGTGAASTLHSIDKVTAALRSRLGEAMQSIQENAVSLPNVTTGNIDALKSYALGVKRIAAGELEEGIQYMERAVALDPGFSLAYLRAGRASASLGDLPAHAGYLAKAAQTRGRLPPREALLLDADLAQSGPVDAALQRWRELIALYPDEYTGQLRLAQALMFLKNDFDEGLTHAQLSIRLQSPFTAASMYLKGMLLLGLERPADAIGAFKEARAMGYKGAGFTYAYAHASTRDYRSAMETLAGRRQTGSATAELEANLARVLLYLDQGRWAEAVAEAAAGTAKADLAGSPILQAEWRLWYLAVLAIAEPGKAVEGIHAEVQRLRDEASRLDRDYPGISRYLLLGAGYAGARLDRRGVVEEVLGTVQAQAVEGYPMLEQMRTVLAAESQRLAGHPTVAIELLAPLAEQENASFPVHSALLRAALSANDSGRALAQARWLATHRGRAYTEEGVDFLPQPFNLTDTTLARLDAAELLASSGDPASASRELGIFKAAWKSGLPPATADRAKLASDHSDLNPKIPVKL